MSQYVAVIVAVLGVMFFIIEYTRSLADNKHDMLKFFLNTFAMILGFVVILLGVQIGTDAGLDASIINILSTVMKVYALVFGLLSLYWFYTILFKAIQAYRLDKQEKNSGERDFE